MAVNEPRCLRIGSRPGRPTLVNGTVTGRPAYGGPWCPLDQHGRAGIGSHRPADDQPPVELLVHPERWTAPGFTNALPPFSWSDSVPFRLTPLKHSTSSGYVDDPGQFDGLLSVSDRLRTAIFPRVSENPLMVTNGAVIRSESPR